MPWVNFISRVSASSSSSIVVARLRFFCLTSIYVVSCLVLIDPAVPDGFLLNLSVNTPSELVIVSSASHGRVETTASGTGLPFSSLTIPVILRGPVGFTSSRGRPAVVLSKDWLLASLKLTVRRISSILISLEVDGSYPIAKTFN